MDPYILPHISFNLYSYVWLSDAYLWMANDDDGEF